MAKVSFHFHDFFVHRRDTFLPSVISDFGSFFHKSANQVDSSLIQSFVGITETTVVKYPVNIAALEQLPSGQRVESSSVLRSWKLSKSS